MLVVGIVTVVREVIADRATHASDNDLRARTVMGLIIAVVDRRSVPRNGRLKHSDDGLHSRPGGCGGGRHRQEVNDAEGDAAVRVFQGPL
eukprot:CAMPEP_0174868842 /NCGR_PEP_ID=MMETSP1114-20130205/66759_1 /TAXON_ID=312471 /ORGANISM="Neobodo designis, Strain CCAP 1951/1" /LENGTH=89 /DNA_ID=CAMNT_0016104071 /DNA_START=34 /DNA_END=303 /DNA_ORIENTATION=-